MKKTITLLLLVVLIGIGAVSTEAKKTRKKAKSSTTSTTISPTGNSNEALSIDIFCCPENVDPWGKLMSFKDTKDIIPQLSRMGFTTVKTTKTVKEEICGSMERYKADFYTSTKTVPEGIITIKIEGTAFSSPVIKFPSTALKDQFIDTAKAAGFVYEGDGFYRGPSECYYDGTDIKVEGNTVTLIIRSEC